MMTFSVSHYLQDHGPARSSTVAAALQAAGMQPAAARQRLSRAIAAEQGVDRLQIPLLPKRESFLCHRSDHGTERFFSHLLRDLRETKSVFAAAVDGVAARGGVVAVADFGTCSGAPVTPQKGQITADVVAKRLVATGLLAEHRHADLGPCLSLPPVVGRAAFGAHKARLLTEGVILDGLREWARDIGLASYNLIQVRGDPQLRAIGPFAFDLAGPSYLLPLQGSATKPGFVVADVIAEGILTEHHIQFFLRKARMLKATLSGVGVLSLLVAEGFTGPALTAGHAAGVMLATPKSLFGSRAAHGVSQLVDTLKNAAAYASSSPERLVSLVNNLVDIEGRAGNLRGILFELIAGHLARRDAVSIDMGVKATDPVTGKTADIDVQKVTHQASTVTAIECKGKGPGGVVTREEVEEWLRRTAIFRAHYRGHASFREARPSFELWTTGSFAPDALALLQAEKVRRTSAPIDWKDGQDVLALARSGKEKTIAGALDQHFIRHPLAELVVAQPVSVAGATPDWMSLPPLNPATASDHARTRALLATSTGYEPVPRRRGLAKGVPQG